MNFFRVFIYSVIVLCSLLIVVHSENITENSSTNISQNITINISNSTNSNSSIVDNLTNVTNTTTNSSLNITVNSTSNTTNLTENTTISNLTNTTNEEENYYRVIQTIQNEYSEDRVLQNFSVEIDVPEDFYDEVLNGNNSVDNLSSEGNVFTTRIHFNDTIGVKLIEFPDLQISNNSIELGIEPLDPDNFTQDIGVNFTQSYAIDPTKLNFTNATVSVLAKGENLYKCELWNFTNQSCYGNVTLFLTNLTPGQEYNFTLTPDDPAFFESITSSDNERRARDGVLQTNVLRMGVNNAGRVFDIYLRFENITVPAGSTINYSYLNLTSTAGRTGVDVFINIYGLKDSNCSHFNTATGGVNPISQPRTGNFTAWDNIPGWSNLENSANTLSPNVSAIIQEIIEQPGWERGNPICFALEDDGSSNNAFRDVAFFTEAASVVHVDYFDPPSTILWTAGSLDFNVEKPSFDEGSVKVRSIINNTNITITEIGGSGSSFINTNSTTVPDLADTEEFNVYFNCTPSVSQTSGTFSSIFEVRSNQDTDGANLTVSCEVVGEPQFEIISPNSGSPLNVNDGDQITISINVSDKFENTLDNASVAISNVQVGGVDVSLTELSAMSLKNEFSTAVQDATPDGIAIYGNKLYVTGGATDSALEYYLNGTFISSTSLTGETTAPRGITTTNGMDILLADNAGANPDNQILNYSTSYQLNNNFSVEGQTTIVRGLGANGTHLFLGQDVAPDSIEIYTNDGTNVGSIDVSALTTSIRGVTVTDKHIYFMDENGAGNDDVIQIYLLNGTYVGEGLDVTTEAIEPTGISTLTGNEFYVADNSNDRILIYRRDILTMNGSLIVFNVTLPTGLAGSQDLTVDIIGFPEDQFSLSDTQSNSLVFPEKDPPGTVTNLSATFISTDYIYWQWDNPSDPDLDYVEIYIDGVNVLNQSAPTSFYNATGLQSNTSYNISLRTVDTNDNINTTFINDTNRTATVPRVFDLRPIAGTPYVAGTNITISANVTDDFPITSVEAFVIWDQDSTTVQLDNITGNMYSTLFNTTSDVSTYNVTIIARNSVGAVNNTETTDFEMASDTPFLDTFINSNNPTGSFGTSSNMNTDSLGNVRRILIQFDTTSSIPEGVIIDNATMRIHLNLGTPVINHSVFAINQTWDNSVTWNTQPSFIPIPRATTEITATTGIYYEWNITDLAREWYNGTLENFGMYVFENGETTDGRKRYTSSNAGSNNPELVINYTDIQSPKVEDLVPSLDSIFQANVSVIELSAKVTDNIGVSSVYANITGSQISLYEQMTLTTNFIYVYNFTNTTLLGNYNVSFFVNDTTNNINNTETTNFTLEDTTNPQIFDFSIDEGGNYNVSNTVEVSANITDNLEILEAYVNITHPQGTIETLTLTNSFQDKYNLSYTFPFSKGYYNLTYYARDSLNNTNTTIQTIFVNSSLALFNEYYGEVEKSIVLGLGLTEFYNFSTSGITFNIYLFDSESSVNWSSLQALGRRIAGVVSNDDFSEIDEVLGNDGYEKNIESLFASDSSTPKQTKSLSVNGNFIANVPFINSTNNSNFETYILWDYSDDIGGNEFDSTDREDLLFVTVANYNQSGKYGIYDYEIVVPETLGNLTGSSNEVTFEVGIN